MTLITADVSRRIILLEALLGVGLEARFDPNKRQAIQTDQPKNIKNINKQNYRHTPNYLVLGWMHSELVREFSLRWR